MNRSLASDKRGVSTAVSIAILALVVGSVLGGYSYYHNSQAQEEAVESLESAGLSHEQAENFHEEYGGGFVLPWEPARTYGKTPAEEDFLEHYAEKPGVWSRLLGDGFTEEAVRRALNGNADGDNMINSRDSHPLRHDHPVTSDYENEVPPQVLRALRPLDGDLELDRNDRALAQRLVNVPEKVLLHKKMRGAIENITEDGSVTESELQALEKNIYNQKNPVTTYAKKTGLPSEVVKKLSPLDNDLTLDSGEREFVKNLADTPEDVLLWQNIIELVENTTQDGTVTDSEVQAAENNIYAKEHPATTYAKNAEIPEDTIDALNPLDSDFSLGPNEKDLVDGIAKYPDNILTQEKFLNELSSVASDGEVSTEEYNNIVNPITGLVENYDLPQEVVDATKGSEELNEQYWTGTQVEDYFQKIASLSSDDLRTFRDQIISDLQDGVSQEEISQYDHPVALYGELKELPENVAEQLKPLQELGVIEKDFVDTVSAYPENVDDIMQQYRAFKDEDPRSKFLEAIARTDGDFESLQLEVFEEAPRDYKTAILEKGLLYKPDWDKDGRMNQTDNQPFKPNDKDGDGILDRFYNANMDNNFDKRPQVTERIDEIEKKMKKLKAEGGSEAKLEELSVKKSRLKRKIEKVGELGDENGKGGLIKHGADPDHKDVFFKIGRMKIGEEYNELTDEARKMAVDFYENAPLSNPDGEDGIGVHFLPRDELPYENKTKTKSIVKFYENNLPEPMKGIVKYAAFVNTPTLKNKPVAGFALGSEAIAITYNPYLHTPNSKEAIEWQAGTFVHETGHLFGLDDHPGRESVMDPFGGPLKHFPEEWKKIENNLGEMEYIHPITIPEEEYE